MEFIIPTLIKLPNKTPLGETRYFTPFLLTPSPNTNGEAARGCILLTVQCLCDLRYTMLHHWPSSASHPTLA